MTPDEFRRWGHESVEWVARYLERVEDVPGPLDGRPRRRPGRCRPTPPRAARAVRPASLADLDRIVLPASPTGSRPTGSPTSRATPPDRRSWATWCRRASACRACSGRPARPAPSSRPTSSTGWSTCWGFRIGSVDRAGRRRHPGHGVERQPRAPSSRPGSGHRRSRRRFAGFGRYASTEAHSSVEKGSASPAWPPRSCGSIDVDDEFAMRPDALDAAVARRPRRRPAFRSSSCATVGTPRRWPSTRWPASPTSASGTACGSTSTPPWPAPPRSSPSCGVVADGVDARRQLVLRPAQVAVHQLRLRRSLGGRPAPLDRRAQHPPRVPAQRGQRVGRGDRLPRLARPARPPVPGAQAVVRAPPLRRRGAAAPHARARALAGELSDWVEPDPRFERLTPTRLNLVLSAPTSTGTTPPSAARRPQRERPGRV